MFKRVVFAALVMILPVLSWAQPNPRFEILTWLDNQWTVIDSNGAFVRTLPITPVERPGFLSLSHDRTKLLFLIRNWQTWEYDFPTGVSRFVSQADWNANSQWLPGRSTEFTFNDASGRLLKFDTLTGIQSVWQSNDTIGGRVYTRLEFDGNAQRALFNIHYGGAGGMGVFLGDVCYADASHAVCNVRPLAWPGNGSTSWSDVAANGVLTGDGSKAVYVERHSTNGAAYLHDIASNTRVSLLNWTGSPEASGGIYGLFEDRYAVMSAQAISQPNSAAYFVCDLEALSCNEILTRPGPDSLSHVAIARSFGDTTPPSLTVPGDITIEATSRDGAVVVYESSAVDDVDGAVAVTCEPPSGSTFSLGFHPVTCVATDAAGNSAQASFEVAVVDTTSPVITSITAKPDLLWPPNGKMIEVEVTATTVDAAGGPVTCVITGISGDDQSTVDDWSITDQLKASLRARRTGSGSGRSYALTVGCTDAANNTSEGRVSVFVPHDQRQ